ncbi:MAG: hypothetical protein H6642_10930 [Caldilineaceae bacterium]|nr:hypothetical protein [Caldilineaceae bacterium]
MADTPNTPTTHSQWDDEIDLRQYVNVLFQWWREILLFTVLAALIGLIAVAGLRYFDIPRYSAGSDVLIARVVSTASLDERYRTTSEESSDTARRSALVSLAKSGAIAEAVISELGDQLSSSEHEPAVLLEKVSAVALPASDNRTPSDLIRITVTADTPEKAAAIANAWATNYVRQINDLLGQIPAEVLVSVEDELVQADQTYQAAQKALEDFITEERINQLTRRIAALQAQVDSLQLGRQTALTAVINQELEARLEQYTNLVDARVLSNNAVLMEQVENRLDELSELYAARTQAGHLLDQSQALLSQIEQGGDAAVAGNMLSLQLLKAQIFAVNATTTRTLPDLNTPDLVSPLRQATLDLPAGLQFSLSNEPSTELTGAEQATDVSAIISALEEHLSRLDVRITQLSDEMLTGAGLEHLDSLTAGAEAQNTEDATTENPLDAATQTSLEQILALDNAEMISQSVGAAAADDELTMLIQSLDREIQAAQSQLEAENAKKLQLTQQRDLAWSAYEALSNKTVELRLERTAANSEVRLASPAIPPIKPIPGPNMNTSVLLATALGFLFGIFYAFMASYMGQKPFLRRKRPRAGQITAAG